MRTHHTAAALAAATLLTLTGCSAVTSEPKPDDTISRPSPNAAAAPPAASASVDIDAVRSAAGLPPSPAPRERATYLATLNGIDPEIVNGKDDRAVSRGLNQCQVIKDMPDPTKRVESTNRRFTGPNHPDGFGLTKAAMILAAVQANICPTY